MVYKVRYSDHAQSDLARIDSSIARRILKKVDENLTLSNPFSKAKKLRGFELETFRFRVGDYRVVFRIDEKTNLLVILIVLKIAHRKDVYG